jgi:hypothetical protein
MALPISKHKSSPYGIPETRGYVKFAFTACIHSKNKHKLPKRSITLKEKHCHFDSPLAWD